MRKKNYGEKLRINRRIHALGYLERNRKSPDPLRKLIVVLWEFLSRFRKLHVGNSLGESQLASLELRGEPL